MGRRIEVRGTVQGVGFRPWVYRLAHENHVAGRVRNDSAGVTIEAFGPPEALDAFVEMLERQPPPPAAIREMRWQPIDADPPADGDFRIVPSGPSGPSESDQQARRVSIPPDIATCADCLAEIADPHDRRFRYAFTNCTNCGPRFTIARDVPYDRARTTMASFTMCDACLREYEDPADRRFHAQPNACAACGPRLWIEPDETVAPDDPIREAAHMLRAGLVVAIKGIGGYHLACDATSAEAVRRLRERKKRDEKPFAVMVEGLAAAGAVAILGEAERTLLARIERPVVLVPRRADAALAAEVAPDNPLVGLLLPYTPLHQLLLAEVGRPLVMTSGNLSEEPIAYEDGDARRRLRPIADVFVVHDRPIESPCDDSVARVIAGRPVVLRRSRGFVPRPISLVRPVLRPVLGCGAQLKNTFCLAAGDAAYFGPHIGDLDGAETFEAYTSAIDRLERFLGIRPEIVAHDLHPVYRSTRWALDRAAPVTIGVQHHHAHVASAMAEHGLLGPVLGVAYDGTGYGTDGTAWGGEVLWATFAGFQRVATFRPMALAGGEQAIRQVWRVALALLDDAFEGDPPLGSLRLFDDIEPSRIDGVRRIIAQRVESPLAHGVGRYFDALGALGLSRPVSRYEGQVAASWNHAADPAEQRRYPFSVQMHAEPWVIDLRPLVREAVRDLIARRGAPTVSAKFHNTLVAATAEVLRAAARRWGRAPVVLTGGCFQNARLAESLVAELSGDLAVHLHAEVPPGDGGIALGQAVVADAVARRS